MRLSRWLPVPPWVFLLALVIYGLLLLIDFLSLPGPGQGWLLLLWVPVGYGIARVALNHPITRPAYRGWLRTTPWSSRQPLPLGPVHLVWQDALALGAMALIAKYQYNWSPLLFVGLGLSSYLLLLAFTLFAAGQENFGWAVGAGIISAWGFLPELRSVGAVLVATYLVAYLGLRRSLAEFPWENRLTDFLRQELLLQGLWFPSPEVRKKGISFKNLVLVSLLSGGLSYVLLKVYIALLPIMLFGEGVRPRISLPAARQAMVEALERDLPQEILACTIMLSLARAGWYCLLHWPPLNLKGRLATGRLIVPQYDKVFVAPLLAVLAAWLLPPYFLRLGIGLPLECGLLVAGLLLIEFGPGPTLYDWQLTGAHRMVRFPQSTRIPGEAQPFRSRQT